MTALARPADLREVLGIPFTDEQLAAASAPLEPGLVVAGAGSGKTETMAARVVWLVANGHVTPDRVLGLTFTRKAAAELGVRVRGLRITHAGMYHLDLAFCPLDDRRALVCPGALDPASAAAVLDLVPEPLVITDDEALTTLCANSVVVGSTVVMPGCPERVRARLEEWGFEVAVVDVSEFHLGGGSVRCLTNPVDITLGRDLVVRPAGEVLLPPV